LEEGVSGENGKKIPIAVWEPSMAGRGKESLLEREKGLKKKKNFDSIDYSERKKRLEDDARKKSAQKREKRERTRRCDSRRPCSAKVQRMRDDRRRKGD